MKSKVFVSLFLIMIVGLFFWASMLGGAGQVSRWVSAQVTGGTVHVLYPKGDSTDQARIQAAIDAAADGDTLLLKATNENGEPTPFILDAGMLRVNEIPLILPRGTMDLKTTFKKGLMNIPKPIMVGKSITIKGEVDGQNVPITRLSRTAAQVGPGAAFGMGSSFQIMFVTHNSAHPRFENLCAEKAVQFAWLFTTFEIKNCWFLTTLGILAMVDECLAYPNLANGSFNNPQKSIMEDCYSDSPYFEMWGSEITMKNNRFDLVDKDFMTPADTGWYYVLIGGASHYHSLGFLGIPTEYLTYNHARNCSFTDNIITWKAKRIYDGVFLWTVAEGSGINENTLIARNKFLQWPGAINNSDSNAWDNSPACILPLSYTEAEEPATISGLSIVDNEFDFSTNPAVWAGETVPAWSGKTGNVVWAITDSANAATNMLSYSNNKIKATGMFTNEYIWWPPEVFSASNGGQCNNARLATNDYRESNILGISRDGNFISFLDGTENAIINNPGGYPPGSMAADELVDFGINTQIIGGGVGHKDKSLAGLRAKALARTKALKDLSRSRI